MESVDVHCSALCTAKNRHLSLATSTYVSTPFRFVVIADPQLGLLEQHVEKRPRPHHWDREVKLHIPFFLEDINEPDNYFNIPIIYRKDFVSKLYQHKIYYAFAGHLHKNNIAYYTPLIIDENNDHTNNNSTDKSFSMISSSSVCVQLGNDQPGIRLVQINTNNNENDDFLKHVYWTLNELEEILNSGKQPEI
ncbi:unnamed protein product [Schistosoma spindalis]|nr:unnamed protein product [Schistosoma spindale]